VSADKLREAAEYEQGIADAAAAVRYGATELTLDLFLVLYDFLRLPIHEGYLETVTAGEGKPYESTGIRSVQVQHDRMNSVLTPLWWQEHVAYEVDGKLCHVTVYIGRDLYGALEDRDVFFDREAWGGVERGSTTGNLYKGSYTNAAKMAFARIGPGHEVYIGALDFDPDVSSDAAKAQATRDELPPVETIDAGNFAKLRDKLDLVLPADDEPEQRQQFLHEFQLQLGVMGVSNAGSVNEALSRLTPAQATDLEAWLVERG
jgi:hypothetical protein